MTTQNLRQEIKQSLKLNANLTQSIKALQLSSEELEEFIEEKILENPFLERSDTTIIEENNYTNISEGRANTRNYESSNDDSFKFIESKISLKDHVLSQINSIFDNEVDLIIARFLTDYLADNGYLIIDKDEISKFLKIDQNKLQNIIAKLQTLDPSGIFAENLTECMNIQLIDKNLFDDKFQKITENLELIASGELQKLVKLTSLTKEALIERINIIKKLDPKPGRNFSNELIIPKTPDVEIKISEENQLVISTTKSAYRTVRISNEYNNAEITKVKEEDKKYISEKMKEANTIVKSVEMRKKTIIKVAEVLIKEQEDFFKRGVMYLKPLTLAKVAEAIGHDESTVSRATSNKYIETPYGIMDMKFFFSSGVKSKYSSSDVSSTKVKEIIKSLIQDEDHSKPLSDDDISAMLKNLSIIAARRTVAKYRDALKIPTSQKRKREYKMQFILNN